MPRCNRIRTRGENYCWRSRSLKGWSRGWRTSTATYKNGRKRQWKERSNVSGQRTRPHRCLQNYAPVSARVLDVAGSPRVACRLTARGAETLERGVTRRFTPTSWVKKGGKRPQIHMYWLDLELPSTAGHTFRLEGIRRFWYSPANLSLPLFLSRGFPVWLRPDF